jgi:hypothetical protein
MIVGMGRRMWIVIAVAALGVWGCSKSSTPTATSSTTSAPTTASTAASSTASTAAGPAGPAACQPGQLSITLGPGSGAAGTFYFSLTFRNASSTTCTLLGYPGVSLVDASGQTIGAPATRDPLVTPALVTLAPGAVANDAIGITDPGVANCPSAAVATVRVYPPNETVAVAVPAGTMSACATVAFPPRVSVLTPGPPST